MAVRRPLVLIGGDIYELPAGDTIAGAPGVSAGATGGALIDFGSGSDLAAVAITGQAGILAGSYVHAWLAPTASPDHSLEEHLVEEIDVFAGSITAGVGFIVWARTRTGSLTGQWSVTWKWE